MASKAPRAPSRPSVVASQPRRHPLGHEVQAFDELRDFPLGLAGEDRAQIASALNVILADIRVLHDLYKKSHWVMRGPTFSQLHLLMDVHAGQLDKLIDSTAERIQTLGAIAVGDARHAAELTTIPRPPDGAEDVPSMLTRLVDAHALVIANARDTAERADDARDLVTNDLLASAVLPVNELQLWFISEHLVDIPFVADGDDEAFGDGDGEDAE